MGVIEKLDRQIKFPITESDAEIIDAYLHEHTDVCINGIVFDRYDLCNIFLHSNDSAFKDKYMNKYDNPVGVVHLPCTSECVNGESDKKFWNNKDVDNDTVDRVAGAFDKLVVMVREASKPKFPITNDNAGRVDLYLQRYPDACIGGIVFAKNAGNSFKCINDSIRQKEFEEKYRHPLGIVYINNAKWYANHDIDTTSWHDNKIDQKTMDRVLEAFAMLVADANKWSEKRKKCDESIDILVDNISAYDVMYSASSDGRYVYIDFKYIDEKFMLYIHNKKITLDGNDAITFTRGQYLYRVACDDINKQEQINNQLRGMHREMLFACIYA